MFMKSIAMNGVSLALPVRTGSAPTLGDLLLAQASGRPMRATGTRQHARRAAPVMA